MHMLSKGSLVRNILYLVTLMSWDFVTYICVLNQNIVFIFWFEIGLLLLCSQDVLHLSNHTIQCPLKLQIQIGFSRELFHFLDFYIYIY